MGFGKDFTCQKCGAKTTVSSGGLMYARAPGDLIYIPHPGEAGRLEALGTTADKAQAERRLYVEEDWACTSCGKMFQHVRLLLPSGILGCKVYVAFTLVGIAGTIYSVSIGRWLLPSWKLAEWHCVVIAWVLFITVLWVIGTIDESIALKRNDKTPEARDPAACPACASTRVKIAMDCSKKDCAFKCPTCGSPGLKITGEWIS